jgi:Zn-dependent protease with chaperone function
LNKDTNNQQVNKDIFTLGHVNPKMLLTVLFLVGIVVIIYYSVIFGIYIASTNTYTTSVETSQGMYSAIQSPNGGLGFIAGLLLFVVLTVIWRVSCELLLLIFGALKAYISSKEERT